MPSCVVNSRERVIHSNALFIPGKGAAVSRHILKSQKTNDQAAYSLIKLWGNTRQHHKPTSTNKPYTEPRQRKREIERQRCVCVSACTSVYIYTHEYMCIYILCMSMCKVLSMIVCGTPILTALRRTFWTNPSNTKPFQSPFKGSLTTLNTKPCKPFYSP